jgi:bifunctional oligoribonuclease and PAP phosphatase NrnA
MEAFYPQFAAEFSRLRGQVAGRRVAVVGHSRPDGDCIGSQVALARLLATSCREVACVNPDPVPRRLAFLAGGMKFLRTEDALRLPAEWAAIFVDCADHARGGERLRARFSSPDGNIDHHLSNAGYAAVNIVDSASAATCEILAGLALDAGLPVDARTAQALYVGILTDTGQFQFNSTSRRCFVLAGELVARGASPAEAGDELYERETLGKLRLLQRFLASLTSECDGRVCIGTLTQADFTGTRTGAEDTEGIVDYARSIEGVDVGILIEERPEGAVKASLRARDPAYRLDLVAGQFNGGGHACAAGLSLKDGAGDFRRRLVEALGRRLREVDAERAGGKAPQAPAGST